MGGKSKSTTVGYHYRPAFHVGLVGRPIDAFLEYRAADKTAWAGELTASGRIQIDAPDLFGGEKDQGGIVGPVDVMFGEPDQMPNPYLVEVFGSQTVAWRGMTTLVFAGGRFGAMNPYQQKSAYKIRKIKAGWDGDWGEDPCWYPETAEIPLLDGAVTMHGPGWEYQIEHFSEPNTVWDNFEFPVDGWLQGGELPFTTNGMSGGTYWNPTRSNIWLRRQMTVHGAGLTLNIGADNGCVVWINGVNVGSSNPNNENIPSNERYPVAYELGSAGPLQVVVKAYAEINSSDEGGNIVSLSFAGAPLLGINPAHLLYYIRTDREKGAEPVASINEASLHAAADRLYGEGFGLCQVVYDPQQDTPDSFTERICRIIGGSFERSLVDGQWYLDLARGDYDLESLPIMGDDDILELKRQPTTLHGVTNSLSVRYFDPARKETIITPAVRALGLIKAFGEVHETLDFPEIPTADLALSVAERELRARITPSETFEVVTRPRADLIGLRRNQYFRLQSPKRGIAEMVCIVGEKDMGTLRSGAIRWKVAQDIYGHPEATYVEVEHGVDVRPPQVPAPIVAARAFEAPYIDVAAALPRAELEALPDDIGFLLGVAARPSHGLDYTMAVKPEGGEFARVANAEWCPTATIAEEIPKGNEPVVVLLDAVRGLDRVPLGSAVLMGAEILRLDSKQLDPPQVTLARGCADTVPWQHEAGARMWFLGDDIAVDSTEYTEGESVDVKFLANTGSQQLPLEAAPTLPVAFAGRQARPYPPGNFLINGEAYPEEVVGDVTVSWTHRDRVLQADQLFSTGQPGVGPEPGTTYIVRYYQPPGVLMHTESGIVGEESSPFSELVDGPAQVTLHSNIDGLESWQGHEWTFTYGAVAYVDWTPADLEIPVALWVNDESQLALDGAGGVAGIQDISQRGLDVLQADAGARPTVAATDLNGRRVLEFDGSQFLDLDAEAGNIFRNVVGGWAFAVYKLDPADVAITERPLVGVSVGTGGAFRFAITASPGNGANTPAAGGRRLDSDSYHGTQGAARAEQWVMLFGSVDYVARTIRLHINGDLEDEATNQFTGSGPSSNTISQRGRIGANFVAGTPTTFFRGQIAEIVVGQGVLDQADVDRLFGYAAHRWGLAGLLDAGHPYKDAAPQYAPPARHGFDALYATEHPLYIAHRGNAYLYPENTDVAYAMSAADGEPILEQDCFVTADGSAVCTHDATAAYTTTSNAAFSTLSDAQVAALTVDSQSWHGSHFSGVSIPLYRDVLSDYIADRIFTTEFKSTASVAAVMADVDAAGVVPGRILFCSSFVDHLADAVSGGHPTMLQGGASTDVTATAISNDVEYAGYDKGVNAGFIQHSVSSGLNVIGYTVNRREQAQVLIKRGVGAIFTDDATYLRADGPLATQSDFSNWMPGMVAGTDDGSRPALSSRGQIIGPGYWGWQTATDDRQFVLQGWACPIKSDPAADDFSIDLKITFDSATTDARWAALFIADAAEMDKAYDDDTRLINGYNLLFRKNGLLEIWRRDGSSAAQLATQSGPMISNGAEVRFRVIVTPASITLQRLDSVGAVDYAVSANDTTYRGGYFHLGRHGAACRFRDIVVS